MTEPLPDAAAGEATPHRSAGALLRAAREREGLHLAVLAATIKVSPSKLEALERDRYDQLPNATFARALAQSVCRSLKIDPRPVLALLPQQDAPPLETATGRLNTPFDDRPQRSDAIGLAWASKPMFIAGGLLLVAAVAVGLLPREWIEGLTPSPAASAPAAPAPLASAPVPPASAVTAVAEAPVASPASVMPTVPLAPASSAASPVTVASSPAAAPSPAAASAPVPRAAAALAINASAASWIEVLDGDGQPLLSRIVQPGESLSVDGRKPLRVRIGNAAGTALSFRGQSVDLTPYTRDNVARLELR